MENSVNFTACRSCFLLLFMIFSRNGHSVATAALVLILFKVSPHTVNGFVGFQHGAGFAIDHLFVNAFSHKRIHQDGGNAKHLMLGVNRNKVHFQGIVGELECL